MMHTFFLHHCYLPLDSPKEGHHAVLSVTVKLYLGIVHRYFCTYLGQKFDGRRRERIFATAGNGEFKDTSGIRRLVGSPNPRLPSQQMILTRHANVVVGRLFQILEFLAEPFGGL
jgi:hypothetical protein